MVFAGLLGIGVCSPGVNAQAPLSLSVTWKANSEPDLAGYYIYYGPQSGVYTNRVSLGKTATAARIEPLAPGGSYYIVMTAFNTANFESLPTRELFYRVPSPPTNTPPSITLIEDQMLLEDHPSAPLRFTVADAESPPNTLTVRARSSNPRLVPEQYILLGGAGNERSLMVVPQLDQWGRADITLEVRDPQGASNSVTFAVVVSSVNDDPIISPIANQTLNEDAPTVKLPFYTFDAETPPDELWIIAFSSNQTLLPDQNIVISGTGNSRALSFTLAPDAYGSSMIDLFVVDTDGSYGWTSFTVTARAVNDLPTLDPIPSFSIDDASSPIRVGLSGISSGAPNEAQTLVVSAISDNPGIVPSPLVNYLSPNGVGSLLVAPLPDTNGTAVITVTVSDGQANTKQSFAVTVRGFNNPPVIYSLPDLAVLRLPMPLRINFAVQDPDTPLDRLVVTGHSSDAAVLPSSNLVFSGTGTQRSLTVNPVLGRTGLVTVTIVVSDGESTVSASFYVLISVASS